ncbi:MAG: MoxR family ATPase [Gemmatimonadetes bacterium]|nr:MoxR family ATPase [Gemmatimonadota bacterium]MBT8405124.1 MoxR family ATPase [Gemmatimonadota bacterium]NNK62611.1 MoxR family ATPase [Gemmatimonadota bacterium]
MAEFGTSTEARPSLELLDRLADEVGRVFHGKRSVIQLAVAALLARGHILFEDVPGVGKTTLAHALAHALGLTFRRVQFTSDLLPSDVLGVSVYHPASGTFEVRHGPIFTQVLLADEINRAPPRTQSGLLQAMQEGTITIDDQTAALPRPFLVLATQNPLEHYGTYPLPESQLDRFLMRLTIGYPEADAERRILLDSRALEPGFDRIQTVLGPDEVLRLQDAVDNVRADEALVDYLMEIVQRTRESALFRLGVSPRGSVALFRAARAYAMTRGRDYLVPDDIRDVVVPCLAHRLLPAGMAAATLDAHEQAASLLRTILDEVEVPV